MYDFESNEAYNVLTGAQVDYGGRYEYLVTSYVALKFLQDPSITGFKLANNDQHFGKFDDLVVETASENGQTHTWAVQLKHSKTGKGISKNELAADGKGDFGINKYFQDYKKQTFPPNTKLLLYTNRQLEENKQFQIAGMPHPINICKSVDLTTTSRVFDTSENSSVYQLKIHEDDDGGGMEECEEYRRFFEQFYIYSDQKNVSKIEAAISELFGTEYGCDGVDKYKKCFETWCRMEPKHGQKHKLYKENIEMELAKILLDPYVKPVHRASGKGKILENAIASSTFNVAIVTEDCESCIDNLWNDTDTRDTDTTISSGSSDKSTICFVKVNESNHNSICKAIGLCTNRKFVLISNYCDLLSKLSNVFKNLSDLQGKNYTEVVENFSCVIQGRPKARLVDVLNDNASLKGSFEVSDLFKMADGKLVIGDNTVELPTPYISRCLPKQIFSFDLIKNLSNDVLVLSDSSGQWDMLMDEFIDGLKNSETVVITDDNNLFSKLEKLELRTPAIIKSKNNNLEFGAVCRRIPKEKNVHQFQIAEDYLIWVDTRGILTPLKEFHKLQTNEAYQDSDISQVSCTGKLNVLLADPGMGKTVFANFLKRNSKFNVWPIKINLRENRVLFTNKDHLLENVLNLEKRVLAEKFRKLHDILFIWDGLDEVGTGEVDLILEGIKKISELGYSQWIMSRCHLGEKLESYFGVFAINLKEITREDQLRYIEQRLGKSDIQAEQIYKRIDNSKLKDMLGIPLLLYMFTEICVNPDNYQKIIQSEISLIHIYAMFIDGKFGHYTSKINQGENALFSKAVDEIKEYRIAKYEQAGLKTCFFDSSIDTDFLENIKNNGDIYGIITNVTPEYDIPIFLHKTFAEYFTALYLSKNFDKVEKKTLDRLFNAGNRNIRLLFDMCLSQNCPAHLAVLELNLGKLERFEDDKMFDTKDKGGRNVLHLACSYGTPRDKLNEIVIEKQSWFSEHFGRKNKTFDGRPLDFISAENEDYEKIVRFLVGKASVTEKDRVYGMNCMDYAFTSMSLFALEVLIPDHQFHFSNYQDIIAYSVVFNYKNLIGSFKKLPYFELERCAENIWRQGFQHFHIYNILILMIEYERIDMLKKALENKDNVKMINRKFSNDSPLSWAVKKGSVDIMDVLLRYKPEKTGYGKNKDNILHIAVEKGYTNVVDYIVDNKLVNIESTNKLKDTPMLIAAKTGDLEMAYHLIEKRAKIDARNENEESLLHCACIGGSLSLVKYLLEDVKFPLNPFEQRAALSSAASLNHFEIVRYLLQKYKASINPKDGIFSGKNVLHFACQKENFDFITHLTRENILYLDSPDENGETPLILAAERGNFEIAHHLIEHGADILSVNPQGWNVLHFACLFKNIEFVKKLTPQHILALDKFNAFGFKPLHYARTCSDESPTGIVEHLNGAPLMLAAESGNFEIAHHLIENGADILSVNPQGWNVLHFACLYKNIEFVKKLTPEHILALDNFNAFGFRPLHYAQTSDDTPTGIVEYVNGIQK